jgi:hypothetical protein
MKVIEGPVNDVGTKTSKIGRITKLVGLIIFVILLVGSLILNIYMFSEISRLNSRIGLLGNDNSRLATLKSTNDRVASTQNTAPVATVKDTHDGNFVALSPNSGLLAYDKQATFEFTPHKDALKYTIEIKYMGQQDYPAISPANQSLTFKSSDVQPSRLQIVLDMLAGDYQWRVTAYSIENGIETALQSTDSWNYQVR